MKTAPSCLERATVRHCPGQGEKTRSWVKRPKVNVGLHAGRAWAGYRSVALDLGISPAGFQARPQRRTSPSPRETAAKRPKRSIALVKSSVMLLGQYDTWSVSRPNMPPFRACEHASSAVLHGSPETLITGNGHTCPKCEPARPRIAAGLRRQSRQSSSYQRPVRRERAVPRSVG